jgi:hypothetical protein
MSYLRAGFEPRGGAGFAHESCCFQIASRARPHVQDGSNPARISVTNMVHPRRVEIFALPPTSPHRPFALSPLRLIPLPHRHNRRIHLLIEPYTGYQEVAPADLRNLAGHRLQPVAGVQSRRESLLVERELC